MTRIPRDTWAAVTIAMIWLAVIFAAVFGPDIVTHDSSGSGAVIPSGAVVAFFAFLATSVIAKRAFDHRSGPDQKA